jgi:hypothetical protein
MLGGGGGFPLGNERRCCLLGFSRVGLDEDVAVWWVDPLVVVLLHAA